MGVGCKGSITVQREIKRHFEKYKLNLKGLMD